MNHAAAPRRGRLRRNRPFIRFLAARGQSEIGSTITEVTVPLLAAVVLHASAAQIGLLMGLNAALQIGLRPLFAVRAERSPDRGAALRKVDFGRCVVGLLIPGLWFADLLSLGVLYGVAVVSAFLSAFFGAYSAPYFTELVDDEEFESAGALLSTVTSVSDVVGPGLAATLMKFLPMPVVLLIDAISYLVGGALLAGRQSIRAPEIDEPTGNFSYAMHGFRQLATGRLVGVAGGIAALALLNAAISANIPTYGTLALGLSPSIIAAAQAAGAVGAVGASAIMVVVGGRLGFRVRASVGLGCLATSLLALNGLTAGHTAAVISLFAYDLLGAFGAVLAMVSLVTQVPRIVPPTALARTMAAATLVPDLGVVIGGALGDHVGVPWLIGGGSLLTGLVTVAAGAHVIRTNATNHPA
ncbi:MFS transporter [Kribbella sp. NBC_01505]|uniref:MFS transporter n=1 Tax=Kribbella sp. NBC_01505 TaxID=2903580 RepID=UPI00386412E4